ncbi:putative disease resistance protein RGA4 [Triticum urartu]|nr:putative disease resistance protein RGA4 [Triticum urartu]
MSSPNDTMLVKGLRLGVEVINGLNECIHFFQWARSMYLRSQRSETQDQDVQNDDDALLHLQSGLQHLRDTLPAMYNLVDRAEWRSHEHHVAELLPRLKDAVYNADDLLDEFRWYEMKAELEGNTSKSPFSDFIGTLIHGSFDKLKDVRERLENLSRQLKRMGLHKVVQRFDKSVRPETTAMPDEAKIFGRAEELKQVMEFLNVPTNAKRKRAKSLANASTSLSANNQVSNESRITYLPVLPIVGIGGVGKTTLAQHNYTDQQVKSHFGLVIWICVSDDFNVKRLIKEVIQSCPRKEATSDSGKDAPADNLNSLQLALSKHVNNQRVLIVLDDIWDDSLKENRQWWNRFCAPLKSAQEGSMMLVTTRCPNVAQGVGTVKPIILEGLKDDVFWNFFKLCVFGSESSSNDPKLELIGKSILPKLKGSPLAAKTLGRMLRMDLQETHWESILHSELWELEQEVTDILPALRLSYMYLLFILQRCFSFCAVYPKDYKFQKEALSEIWVAKGFVEAQGDDSFQKAGWQHFEDLVTRSFFQKVNGGYVIHDLLHDMAQKVSEHDCCILRNKNDYEKVPENVRRVYIFRNRNVGNSDLVSLCKHKTLRTLICEKQLGSTTSTVMDKWCTNLPRLRVISLTTTNELPYSIGNLKHLRYLKISEDCSLSIPSNFCWLYNLQILDVTNCSLESLPYGFSNLSTLRRFVSQGFSYSADCTYLNAANMQLQGTKLIKNLNQIRGCLDIIEVRMLSEDHAAELELKNKKYLHELKLNWSFESSAVLSPNEQYNGTEVLQVLQPSIDLRSLSLGKYPGVSLPTWFEPQNLPSLVSLSIDSCYALNSISIPGHTWHSNLALLEELVICDCPSLVSIGGAKAVAKIKKVEIYKCPNLKEADQIMRRGRRSSRRNN